MPLVGCQVFFVFLPALENEDPIKADWCSKNCWKMNFAENGESPFVGDLKKGKEAMSLSL